MSNIRPSELVEHGIKQMFNENYESAILTFTEALEHYPRRRHLLFPLGFIYTLCKMDE